MENSSKNFFKEIKDKEKNLVIWNESKISRHFKSKYPELEKSKNKKKFFKSKGKKSAMSTWEDMDNSTSDEEDEEETNLCLMDDIEIEESKSEQEEDVDFDRPKSLKQAYHELLSNSSTLSKAYKSLRKEYRWCYARQELGQSNVRRTWLVLEKWCKATRGTTQGQESNWSQVGVQKKTGWGW